ncbi:MAG: DEAD/DEAH box helicase [Tahibacter sp.]
MDRSRFLELLAELDWSAYFGRAALERGERYAEKGQVIELDYAARDGSGVLHGRVQGNQAEAYTTTLTIREPGRLADVRSECSCPLDSKCKHVAALMTEELGTLLEMIRAPSGLLRSSLAASGVAPAIDSTATAKPALPDLRPWDHWLHTLQVPAPPEAPPPAERVLGFLFQITQGTPPALCAQAVWFKQGKRGGLVSPKPVQPSPGMADPWAGLDPDQFQRIAELRMAPLEYSLGASWHRLTSPRHEAWLSDVLSNVPCFFGKNATTPIVIGPPRTLQWQWRSETTGAQHLAPVIDGASDHTRLLRIAGLWHWDAERRAIGRIDADAALTERLLRAPRVQPEQALALRERWQHAKPLAGLPAPTDPGKVEIIRTVPVPVLRLGSLPARQYTRGHVHNYQAGCLQLSYDYAGQRLRPAVNGPTERRMIGTKVVEIVRDRSAEIAACERLDQHRLVDAAEVAFTHGLSSSRLEAGDFVLERGRHELAPPDHLLSLALRLQADGFQLEFDAGSPVEITAPPDSWHAEVDDSGNPWFDLSLGIEIGGERVDLLPILQRALSDPSFPIKASPKEAEDAVWLAPIDDRRRVPLPVARVRALIAPLLEWLEQGELRDSLRLRRAQADIIEEVSRSAGLPWSGATRLKEMLVQLQAARQPVMEPDGFNATLRGYQRDGLAWLDFLAEARLGGVLADDMGLGKTVQVLAHLLAEKQRGRLDAPALVIAPTSLVWNWRAEAQRFAPDLRVLILHGATREARFEAIPEHDLVITTYPLLARDRDRLMPYRYALLIFDEAQAIKNARTQAAKVVRELDAGRRLAMTGTPLENHLGELWAQFDAVEPGLLGDEKSFTRHYRTPIEKHADPERQAKLHRRIAPLMLRRRKEDVLTELPPKTIIQREVQLLGKQRELYESLRLAQHERVREAIRERGLAQSGIVVLDALLKLRQVCCDPRLVKLERVRGNEESAKLELLMDLLRELVAEGRRVLVFSQFAQMLELIEQALDEEQIVYQTLTGKTRDRAELVERFQAGAVPVFLISLKAGGVGLNLTAADTVIHYDPWWNPAVEAQATDRAHRIGQDKSVFVYKLICAGTVEEKIQGLQQRKADLAQAVLEGGSTQALRFDESDLAELFGETV